MELNREQIIKALECCSSSDGVIACESGCPYWGEDYDTCPCTEDPNFIIKNALALIKELTEENEAWENHLIDTEERWSKGYYELACEVEDLRKENEKLHASYTELERKCASLNDANERLRDELTKRPPKLVITKLSKKESKNV